MKLIEVDVGGTFTDVVYTDADTRQPPHQIAAGLVLLAAILTSGSPLVFFDPQSSILNP